MRLLSLLLSLLLCGLSLLLLFCGLSLLLFFRVSLLLFWWSRSSLLRRGRLLSRQILLSRWWSMCFFWSPHPLHQVSSSSRAFHPRLMMPSELVLFAHLIAGALCETHQICSVKTDDSCNSHPLTLRLMDSLTLLSSGTLHLQEREPHLIGLDLAIQLFLMFALASTSIAAIRHLSVLGLFPSCSNSARSVIVSKKRGLEPAVLIRNPSLGKYPLCCTRLFFASVKSSSNCWKSASSMSRSFHRSVFHHAKISRMVLDLLRVPVSFSPQRFLVLRLGGRNPLLFCAR